jgi:uncharacterized protein
MNAIPLLIFLGAATVATSFLSGILGMAGGMILMGALLLVLPVPQAMVLHGITQLASNGWRAFLWRKGIAWRIIRGYAAGAALALALFGSLQIVLDRPMVLIALGATPFLIHLMPRRLELNADRTGQPFLCGLSCMSVQLLSGVSGPLLDSFFLRSAMDRKAVVATKAAAQTLGHAAKIGYFAALAGNAGADPLLAGAMVVCAVAGTSASRRLLERMTDADFRDWTRRAILAIGGFYLASGLWSVMA